MSEKTRFSYSPSGGEAEDGADITASTRKKRRQDIDDIARQTGAAKSAKTTAAASAAKSAPGGEAAKKETVKKLREERAARSDDKAVYGEELSSAKKASVKTSAPESASSAAAAKQGGDVQLELIKKREKAKSSGAQWKGEPAAESAAGRMTKEAKRASFSSLAPSASETAASASKRSATAQQASLDFKEVDEVFGETTSSKERLAAKRGAKSGAAKKASGKRAAASAKASPRNAKKSSKKNKKKSGKALKWVLIGGGGLLVAALALAALYLFGIVNLFPSRPITYSASDSSTFLTYLSHPSLKAGDTIALSEPVTVDIDETYGGFVSLPLVNLENVEFQNGTLLLLGGANQDSASLDGVSFTNVEVYIDATHTDLSWSGYTDDTYINCRTLNGSPHLTDVSFPIVGARMSIPVTLVNTGPALTNAEVTFSSPSYIFTEGETYLVDSIPANSSVSVEVPVIAVEGGRTRIYAHDSSGAVSGDSGFINIVGTGYYSGDLHTHSTASVYKRYSTIEENVEYGYKNGMSFIVSVENYTSEDEDDYADELVWAQEAAEREAAEEAAAEAAAAAAAASGETEETTETTESTESTERRRYGLL
ncbi:MAG: hypothetical protein Q4B42_01615 [Oscillospiraceae bacterium]|nr:hypothetical protein [Oscillospiraceae bacterium]